MNQHVKRALMAMGILGIAASAFATDVKQYTWYGAPIVMAQYTHDLIGGKPLELFCPNGDFAISAGHFFTTGDGSTIAYPHDNGQPGSDVPIADKDRDGSTGYQINVQNDEPTDVLWTYVQCLSLSGQKQER